PVRPQFGQGAKEKTVPKDGLFMSGHWPRKFRSLRRAIIFFILVDFPSRGIGKIKGDFAVCGRRPACAAGPRRVADPDPLFACGRVSVPFLLLGNQNLGTTHIRLEHLRDGDGAVCLEMVLEECDQHTRRSNNGVVQGMSQVQLTVLTTYTNLQAASLCVAQVGARANLEVLLLAGAPSLDVAGLN